MPDIIKNAEDCAREIIEGMGFELVGVDYGREDGLMCLTYYIYSEQGVNIDDCERVSRAIEPAVEEKDPVCGEKYCLCVSSPGERPFKTERDYERNIGKTVQAELNTPIKGKKKKFTGTLLAFSASMVIIEGRKEKYELARADIKTIRPYIGP
ncbi:MAG TPA: ribosome maturation factor RimP [Firmicutes bacterium]|nr:ribosome maturation factor RimP [Bacillota bacterium]